MSVVSSLQSDFTKLFQTPELASDIKSKEGVVKAHFDKFAEMAAELAVVRVDFAKMVPPVQRGSPPMETTLPPGSTATTGGGGTEGRVLTTPAIQVDDDAGVQPGQGSASSTGPTERSKSAPAAAKGKKKAADCTLEEISQQIKQRKLVGKQSPVNMED